MTWRTTSYLLTMWLVIGSLLVLDLRPVSAGETVLVGDCSTLCIDDGAFFDHTEDIVAGRPEVAADSGYQCAGRPYPILARDARACSARKARAPPQFLIFEPCPWASRP